MIKMALHLFGYDLRACTHPLPRRQVDLRRRL